MEKQNEFMRFAIGLAAEKGISLGAAVELIHKTSPGLCEQAAALERQPSSMEC